MKGIVSLAVVTVLYILIEHTVQSFKGIKMCQRDCELTKGCTGIHYDPVHLDCRLLFDLEKTEDAASPTVTKNIVKKPSLEKRMEMCSVKSRLIVTGQKKDICVESEGNKTGNKHSRIIIVGRQSYQMDLKTRVVREFHFPWKYIHCIVYLKDAQRFVLGVKHELIASPIINMKRISLRRNVFVYDIAEDEAENVLFAGTLRTSTAVRVHVCQMCTLNLKGGHVRYFVPESNFVLRFAVDTNHKLVYIYTFRRIASYTYHGDKTNDLKISAIHLRCLVYDSSQNVLYYTSGSRLMKATMKGRIPVIKLKQSIYSMVIHGNFFYILYTGNAMNWGVAFFTLSNDKKLKVQTIRLQSPESPDSKLCLV